MRLLLNLELTITCLQNQMYTEYIKLQIIPMTI